MFFLISCAAASGKTTVAKALSSRLEDIVCHDYDEKKAIDEYTRCHQLEEWVQLTLAHQLEAQDFLLTSHSPLGELLACPSARNLAGISACLLDCSARLEFNVCEHGESIPDGRQHRMFSIGLPGTECTPGIRNGNNMSLLRMVHLNTPMNDG